MTKDEQIIEGKTQSVTPEEVADLVRLTLIDGIGSLLTGRLLARFGSPQGVFIATRSDLTSVPGISSRLATAIQESTASRAANVLIQCQQAGIDLIAKRDSRYPNNLQRIEDAPELLYVAGHFEPQDEFALAIVGTRAASFYGKKQATQLTTGLVQAGMTIVSGLARGIDGTAHRAALNAGGRTIAVLGSGLLRVFPPEHDELARAISQQGAVVSEFPPEVSPNKGHFPRRNRIVSGLSLGVLVVESPRRSGTLITARLAAEQNREVFAVPGPIDAENSRGCHQLLRDGAVLVESTADILDALGPLTAPVPIEQLATPMRVPREMQLNSREQTVLALLDATSIPIEAVIEQSGLPAHQVLTALSVLEMKRIVQRDGGNRVRRI
ncbi:MAG: DNA-processing protein DprA [Planctomycetia bacterium]|nr:DNA-processing protein DprA [Planctomycetia bacterium]